MLAASPWIPKNVFEPFVANAFKLAMEIVIVLNIIIDLRFESQKLLF